MVSFGNHLRSPLGPKVVPLFGATLDTHADQPEELKPEHTEPASLDGINGQSFAAEAPATTLAQRIDKSLLAIPEPRRIRDAAHLRFVAEQPCLICGRSPSEAHHLRFAQARALGRKVSDAYTVPLCRPPSPRTPRPRQREGLVVRKAP